jgi:hypothetical protein
MMKGEVSQEVVFEPDHYSLSTDIFLFPRQQDLDHNNLLILIKGKTLALYFSSTVVSMPVLLNK